MYRIYQDKRIENYIESQFRKIIKRVEGKYTSDYENEYIIYHSNEYTKLYYNFPNQKIRIIFSILHSIINENYEKMNERLPTKEHGVHFWADESRNLIFAIEIIREMEQKLKDSPFSFELDEYYEKIVRKCEKFLRSSEGSEIPPYMDKIELYYSLPLFIKQDFIKIDGVEKSGKHSKLTLIGEGSYAQVFSFKDNFYNKKFILKRAKRDLNDKELERFKREFTTIESLSSPYIIQRYIGTTMIKMNTLWSIWILHLESTLKRITLR